MSPSTVRGCTDELTPDEAERCGTCFNVAVTLALSSSVFPSRQNRGNVPA